MKRKLDLPKLAPWIAAVVALVGAASVLRPTGAVRGMDLDAFGHVPVLEGGRVKPIDSLARNALMMIRGKQSARVDRDGDGEPETSIGADEWLLDVMFRPELADHHPVFRVDDPDVLGLMGIAQSTQHDFSFATLAPHVEEIQRQARQAQMLEAQQRTRFQSAVLNLFEKIYLYYRLKNTVQLD
ncbi:MAG TPA: cytochrome C assembly protein, partial [Anaeromyxobacteraceae bacterium]|nr:cytochrome C assembly protein [Anaeromyxobacteraceae bacterium]